MKYIFLFFVVIATSCSVVKKSEGEDGKPGENGGSSMTNEKGIDGKNGENGKSKTVGMKL
jgi:hypothetical protein